MKKVLLLITLLCLNTLYGTKSQNQRSISEYTIKKNQETALNHLNTCENISDDVKALIATQLKTCDTFADMVKAIKTSCLTNTELNTIVNELHGNSKGFAELVEVLRRRFGEQILNKLTEQFGTPVAKKYIETRNQLINGLLNKNIKEITNAIQNGAYINLTFRLKHDIKGMNFTPLRYAIWTQQIDAVKLLLQVGAKPVKRGFTCSGKRTLAEKELEKAIDKILEKALKEQGDASENGNSPVRIVQKVNKPFRGKSIRL